MTFDDLEGYVDPAEEFLAPRARVSACASVLGVAHYFVKETLDGNEDFGASIIVLGWLEVERLMRAIMNFRLRRHEVILMRYIEVNAWVSLYFFIGFFWLNQDGRFNFFFFFLKIFFMRWYFPFGGSFKQIDFLYFLLAFEILLVAEFVSALNRLYLF